jgi:enamine deaminase RidA (YjgF/YER057c/UK114 family)
MPKQAYCADSVLNPPSFQQGVKVSGSGTTLYLAGQVALNDKGETVGRGDFAAQARQSLANVKAMVEAGGGTLADVVKLTFYITDIANRAALGPIRHEFFGPVLPPTTLIATPSLGHADFLIEVDAIAFVETTAFEAPGF